MFRIFLIAFLGIGGFFYFNQSSYKSSEKIQKKGIKNLRDSFLVKIPVSTGFDFPVGKPNAKGYYNAQKFRENTHLGEDWNAVTGGNSDLGHPMYSISDGRVLFAQNIHGGWGNVVRIVHKVKVNDRFQYYESLYAHMAEIYVDSGVIVKRGQKLGTIGNNNGQYSAHLHLELRDSLWMEIGGGYDSVYDGFINPTEFIKKHRP